MAVTEIDEIVIRAGAGAHLTVCKYEAIQLCIQHKERVRLVHNSRNYIVTPQALLDVITTDGDEQGS